MHEVRPQCLQQEIRTVTWGYGGSLGVDGVADAFAEDAGSIKAARHERNDWVRRSASSGAAGRWQRA